MKLSQTRLCNGEELLKAHHGVVGFAQSVVGLSLVKQCGTHVDVVRSQDGLTNGKGLSVGLDSALVVPTLRLDPSQIVKIGPDHEMVWTENGLVQTQTRLESLEGLFRIVGKAVPDHPHAIQHGSHWKRFRSTRIGCQRQCRFENHNGIGRMVVQVVYLSHTQESSHRGSSSSSRCCCCCCGCVHKRRGAAGQGLTKSPHGLFMLGLETIQPTKVVKNGSIHMVREGGGVIVQQLWTKIQTLVVIGTVRNTAGILRFVVVVVVVGNGQQRQWNHHSPPHVLRVVSCCFVWLLILLLLLLLLTTLLSVGRGDVLVEGGSLCFFLATALAIAIALLLLRLYQTKSLLQHFLGCIVLFLIVLFH